MLKTPTSLSVGGRGNTGDNRGNKSFSFAPDPDMRFFLGSAHKPDEGKSSSPQTNGVCVGGGVLKPGQVETFKQGQLCLVGVVCPSVRLLLTFMSA